MRGWRGSWFSLSAIVLHTPTRGKRSTNRTRALLRANEGERARTSRGHLNDQSKVISRGCARIFDIMIVSVRACKRTNHTLCHRRENKSAHPLRACAQGTRRGEVASNAPPVGLRSRSACPAKWARARAGLVTFARCVPCKVGTRARWVSATIPLHSAYIKHPTLKARGGVFWAWVK